jgi:hypothetical protein
MTPKADGKNVILSFELPDELDSARLEVFVETPFAVTPEHAMSKAGQAK